MKDEVKGEDIFERVQNAPDKSTIININGKCVRVYIRDHSHYEWTQDLGMETDCFTDGNKVHFYYCDILQEMADMGREKLYHVQGRPGNVYVVDFKNKKNVKLRLAWCHSCLQVMESKSQIYLTYMERRTVASCGDATECLDCVEALYNGKESFDVIQQKVRNFLKPK